MIKEIIMCVLGTIGFSITMKAPKNTIIYIAVGSLITASIERLLSAKYGDFTACLSAMITLSIFCEIIARIIKEPTTIILMPSTIPLLPGSSIYYTMFYAIENNKPLLAKYASSTLSAGLGIALGAVISSTFVKIILSFKKHKK